MAESVGKISSADIGFRLALSRKRYGISQSELAIKMQTTQATISRRESGAVIFDIFQLKMLCDCLQVSPNYILYGKKRVF